MKNVFFLSGKDLSKKQMGLESIHNITSTKELLFYSQIAHHLILPTSFSVLFNRTILISNVHLLSDSQQSVLLNAIKNEVLEKNHINLVFDYQSKEDLLNKSINPKLKEIISENLFDCDLYEDFLIRNRVREHLKNKEVAYA